MYIIYMFCSSFRAGLYSWYAIKSGLVGQAQYQRLEGRKVLLSARVAGPGGSVPQVSTNETTPAGTVAFTFPGGESVTGQVWLPLWRSPGDCSANQSQSERSVEAPRLCSQLTYQSTALIIVLPRILSIRVSIVFRKECIYIHVRFSYYSETCSWTTLFH